MVETKFGVKYKSRTSFYLIFRQAKFTWHKPGRVYQLRDEAEVRTWEADLLPRLQAAWDDPDIEILCEDEMSLSS